VITTTLGAEVTHRDRIAELLALYAYREGDFVLSSGRASKFYLDAKQVTYRPEGMSLVGHAVLDLLSSHRIQAIGGLTLGADAIVGSTVMASGVQGRPVPGFVVRKSPKTHGLSKWIEGPSPAHQRVAIVDDVVTTGKSVLDAVTRAKDAGAIVVAVVALVDRQEGGAQKIEDETGLPFLTVCSLDDVREASARLSLSNSR
jgi:orotate phosphoribosyltransferase